MVAKVVEANLPFSYRLSEPGNTEGHFPVMLETTAAVHPGGSGGAVVNSNGHMIGLVTRYDKVDLFTCNSPLEVVFAIENALFYFYHTHAQSPPPKKKKGKEKERERKQSHQSICRGKRLQSTCM